MSNIDRAADVIDQWAQEGYELNSAVGSPHAIAEHLADAGLITPDLPEPQRIGQELVWPLGDPDGWEVTATDDYIRLSDERGAIITVNRKLARELGHIFLAAAIYGEVGNRE